MFAALVRSLLTLLWFRKQSKIHFFYDFLSFRRCRAAQAYAKPTCMNAFHASFFRIIVLIYVRSALCGYGYGLFYVNCENILTDEMARECVLATNKFAYRSLLVWSSEDGRRCEQIFILFVSHIIFHFDMNLELQSYTYIRAFKYGAVPRTGSLPVAHFVFIGPLCIFDTRPPRWIREKKNALPFINGIYIDLEYCHSHAFFKWERSFLDNREIATQQHVWWW